MNRLFAVFALVLTLTLGLTKPALAASEHEQHDASQSEKMKHGTARGTFTHKEVIDGVRTEFKVMSLESMDMKDPGGATHHVMVQFFHDGTDHQIKDAVGKIKVISPSGKEQIGSLQNYSGIYAANFTFEEKGNYGVICLFKVNGQKRLVKFWYMYDDPQS